MMDVKCVLYIDKTRLAVFGTSTIAAQKNLPSKKPDLYKGEIRMNRFSIGFNDKELEKLEEIVEWYSAKVGQRVSRCKVIKALLFGAYIEQVNSQLCS